MSGTTPAEARLPAGISLATGHRHKAQVCWPLKREPAERRVRIPGPGTRIQRFGTAPAIDSRARQNATWHGNNDPKKKGGPRGTRLFRQHPAQGAGGRAMRIAESESVCAGRPRMENPSSVTLFATVAAVLVRLPCTRAR